MNVDKELTGITQKAPFIVVLGKPGTENCQYMIACEGFILSESKSFRDSLIDVVSAYYVFDSLSQTFGLMLDIFPTFCFWLKG